MRLSRTFWLATLACLLARVGQPAQAHGPDHEVIVALTAEIARNPGDPERLLHRGERYRSHGDLASARLDFQAALSNNPACHPARLRLALVARDQEKLPESLHLLDQTLAAQPTNLLARVARADVLIRSGRPGEAIPEYDRIIADSPQPRPDVFLSRSRTLLAHDTNAWARALEGVEDGIRRLGPVPSLQLHALELEERGGRVDAALVRIDAIMAGMDRRERWLARRGDVLLAAGRTRDARTEYQRSLAALDRLPERLRRTIASEELRQELEAKLAVNPSGNQTSPSR
jgi:tetratricopeptide (TPR) repeat protein